MSGIKCSIGITKEKIEGIIGKDTIKNLTDAECQSIVTLLNKSYSQESLLDEKNKDAIIEFINNHRKMAKEGSIFTWATTSDNSYEVSTLASKQGMSKQEGDARFSALNAKFKKGTIIDGVDVGGMSIEDVYQKVIKKSGKGKAPAKDSKLNIDRTLPNGQPAWINDNTENLLPHDLWHKLYGVYTNSYEAVGVQTPDITKEDLEDFSYYMAYLPLWQEWARQNPKLIEELRENARGKTLTDTFARNTIVSQARALSDILNSNSTESEFTRKIDSIDNQITDDMDESDIVNLLVKNGIIEKGYWGILGREIIMANINGVKIPFYRSSNGTSGKKAGKWYQFFGFGNMDSSSKNNDWFIKGNNKNNNEVENGYGSIDIQKLTDFLNKYFNWTGKHDKMNMHSVYDFTEKGIEGGNHDFLGPQRTEDINTILYGTKDKDLTGINARKALEERVNMIKANSKAISPVREDNKEETKNTTSVTRIISGGQTGVDTIGLQVAKGLGIETGGKAPKGFLREDGVDKEDIESYGLEEITDEEQEEYTNRTGKKDPYTGRTDLNVKNSDGTVYFNYGKDSAGLIATRRSAEEHKKPFLVNPTAEELRQWIKKNNIKTLNVAGNRGSKL